MMPHVTFVRSLSTIQSEQIYDFKTEAVVFGDVEGYRVIARLLRRAQTARRVLNLHDAAAGTPVGMLCAIIPADRQLDGVRLKLIERLVFVKRRPKMELVIHGTQIAYERLATVFELMISHSTDIPQDHTHVGDWSDQWTKEGWMVPRSVSVNIRGPLEKWTKTGLQEYEQFVYHSTRFTLPDEYDRILEPYASVSLRSNPWLRLA
jgi:hypothetical protein